MYMYVYVLNYNVYMFVALLCKAISHDALKEYVLHLHVHVCTTVHVYMYTLNTYVYVHGHYKMYMFVALLRKVFHMMH